MLKRKAVWNEFIQKGVALLEMVVWGLWHIFIGLKVSEGKEISVKFGYELDIYIGLVIILISISRAIWDLVRNKNRTQNS